MEQHPYLDGPFPRAYAHRGWHTGELVGFENTAVAFHRAVDEGFPYLELDAHASSDGVAVVHHDATLDRTTDGHGAIGSLTAAQLADVRVRGREPLPLLEEVLKDLPDTRVTVELKSDAAVPAVLAVLERTDTWHRVCLGGFTERWLTRARALAGRRLLTSMAQISAVGLRSRAWLDGLPGPLAKLPAPVPVRGNLAQLPRRLGPLTVVDEALLRAAHASGREVHVWTIDDPDEMHDLLDLGVDGLMSDRPDLLREVLQKRDQWVS